MDKARQILDETVHNYANGKVTYQVFDKLSRDYQAALRSRKHAMKSVLDRQPMDALDAKRAYYGSLEHYTSVVQEYEQFKSFSGFVERTQEFKVVVPSQLLLTSWEYSKAFTTICIKLNELKARHARVTIDLPMTRLGGNDKHVSDYRKILSSLLRAVDRFAGAHIALLLQVVEASVESSLVHYLFALIKREQGMVQLAKGLKDAVPTVARLIYPLASKSADLLRAMFVLTTRNAFEHVEKTLEGLSTLGCDCLNQTLGELDKVEWKPHEGHSYFA